MPVAPPLGLTDPRLVALMKIKTDVSKEMRGQRRELVIWGGL